jgi:ADP-ribose pyrophosphatase
MSGSRWKVLSERHVVDRRWLRVTEQHVQLPNGHEIPEFHLLSGPDWAACLALTPQRQLVLVRQYRHGIAEECLEMPAGVIDAGEDGRAAAERELLEETGYAAREFRPISVVSTEPSRHTARAHFFLALDAVPAQSQRLEPSEQISVELWPAAQLIELIRSGKIVHGVQIGALLLALYSGWLEPG